MKMEAQSRWIWPLALFLLVWGCAPVLTPNAVVRFYAPAELSVIKPDSKIALITLNNFGYDHSMQLLQEVAGQINRRDYCKATVKRHYKLGPGNRDDYIIAVDNFMVYRNDSPAQLRYNTRIIKREAVQRDRKGKVVSGRDYLQEERFSTAIATLITAVSIYEARHLEPLFYFNIVSTESDMKKRAGRPAGENYFEKQLSGQIVDKIKRATTRGTNRRGVILPGRADPTARRLLISGDDDGAEKALAPLLPFSIDEKDSAEILGFYKQLEARAAAEKKKGDKPVAKRNMETDLANFYVDVMAREAKDISADNILTTYNDYVKLLSLTQDDQLIKACAHSLGRVELKAARVQPNLLRVEEKSSEALIQPDTATSVEINRRTRERVR
jgi:hypothetical protein